MLGVSPRITIHFLGEQWAETACLWLQETRLGTTHGPSCMFPGPRFELHFITPQSPQALGYLSTARYISANGTFPPSALVRGVCPRNARPRTRPSVSSNNPMPVKDPSSRLPALILSHAGATYSPVLRVSTTVSVISTRIPTLLYASEVVPSTLWSDKSKSTWPAHSPTTRLLASPTGLASSTLTLSRPLKLQRGRHGKRGCTSGNGILSTIPRRRGSY